MIQSVQTFVVDGAVLNPNDPYHQLQVLQFCKVVLKQLLTLGCIFTSPVLSYIGISCLAGPGYWLSPVVYMSHLNKVRLGLQLTLLGSSCRALLMVADGLHPPPNGRAAAQATSHLDTLRRHWLCEDSDIDETVCSTIHRIWQQAEKCKLEWHPEGQVMWDASHEVLTYSSTQLCMAQWREVVADLLTRCTTQLYERLLFGLLSRGGEGGDAA